MISTHSNSTTATVLFKQTPESTINAQTAQKKPLFIAPRMYQKLPLTPTRSLDERVIQIARHQAPLLRKGYKPQPLQEQVAVQNHVHQDIALTILEESINDQKHKQLLNLQVFEDPFVKTLLTQDPKLVRASSVSDLRHAVRGSGSNTPSSKSRRSSGCSSNISTQSSQPASPVKTTSMDEIPWKQQSLAYLREQRDEALKVVNATIAEISEKRIFPNAAPDSPQLILNKTQYYTLIKQSKTEHYEFLNHAGISIPANGYCIFAVSEADPTQIRCLPEQSIAHEDQKAGKRGLLKGHTSLTEGKPVLAAGSMYFENSELIQWDNGSGHYATRASLMLKNIAHIKHLLPKSKFVFNFDDMGHSGYRVFLDAPSDKSLPPELTKLIYLDKTKIPQSCHQSIQKTINLYQILHHLKYALEQQIKNIDQPLLLPDVYSQQTLKDVLDFQQREPNLGTNFLAAYLDMLSLSIQYKWLEPEEMFYNLTNRPLEARYSFIEQCAQLSHRYTLLGRKHAHLIGKLFQTKAIDSEKFIPIILGHYDNPLVKNKSNEKGHWRTLIEQALTKSNHKKADGGYLLISLKKSTPTNARTEKNIYNVLSEYGVASESINYFHLLNKRKRKVLIKNIRIFESKKQQFLSKNSLRFDSKSIQVVSDLLANTPLKKSLHNQTKDLDEKIKKTLIDNQMASYLKSQKPNINDIWNIKIEPYVKRYKISLGDSLHVRRQKNNDIAYLRKLPDTFYQNLLNEFNKNPKIRKLVRMYALQNFEPLAIPNTLESEKLSKKKVDTQKTLIEVSYLSNSDSIEIINNELQKHLKNCIIPSWGKP